MSNNNIFDNMAQGMGGNAQQGNYDNWNEMVGSAPPDKFGHAVTNAVQQIDPQEYYQHVQPGAGGTDPLGSLGQGQLGGVVGSLLGALGQRGVNPSSIGQATGLGNINPNNMNPQDAAALLQYVQQNHPQALGQVAQQYQNQPNILQGLLGNKALMLAAGAIGGKLLSDHMNQNPNQHSR